MKDFLQRWLINTLAVLVAVYVVGGLHDRHWLEQTITYRGHADVVIAALVLGILNALLRPLLLLLSLPLLLFTLGLFTLVINALLLWLTGALLRPVFVVEGFWPAFWGALVISIVSLVLNTLTGSGGNRIQIKRVKPRGGKGDDDKVIDV